MLATLPSCSDSAEQGEGCTGTETTASITGKLNNPSSRNGTGQKEQNETA